LRVSVKSGVPRGVITRATEVRIIRWYDYKTLRTPRPYFFSMALPAHSAPRPLIQLRNLFYTDGRTPWTSDQPVARPLPTHRTTQTQNKRIQTPNIHALSGIRSHDPSV
jgi:hypothetical protein